VIDVRHDRSLGDGVMVSIWAVKLGCGGQGGRVGVAEGLVQLTVRHVRPYDTSASAPGRIGQIVTAALVLLHVEHGRTT
jgi:hypothetical protein